MGLFENITRKLAKFLEQKKPTADTKLSKNFKLGEFACNDANHTQVPDQYINNVIDLTKNLQVIREYADSPIKIFSGYRTPEHNKKIGGVKNSKHMIALAADLKADKLSVEHLHSLILLLIKEGKISEGGVGHYPGRFVHYDIRGTRARWTGKAK